jgi:broad specificity phosphatase PhoE
MNMKKFVARKAFPVICAAFISVVIAGCGDDSSNSTPASPETTNPVVTPTDSSTTTPVTDPVTDPSTTPTDPTVTDPSTDPATNPENPGQDPVVTDPTDPVTNPPADTTVNPSTPTDPTMTAAGFYRDPAAAGLVLAPDTNGFYDVGDIYKAVPADAKIVYVLRHAERESGLGKESPLTEVGLQQALDVGAKLKSDESFYYGATDFLRTQTTAAKIAEGRGETTEVVTMEEINGGYFLTVPSDSLDAMVSKRGGSFKYVAMWCYEQPFPNLLVNLGLPGYFYELMPRGDQFVNEVVLANLPYWKRVNVLITHDLLTQPLAVYASNRTIDLKTYESYRWINYIAGVTVIVTADNKVVVLPTRGVERGFLNTRDMVK